MKKDMDKLFSKSIQTYYFLLVIVVIIKVLGGNYFGIVYTNKTINIINDFITTYKLENIWYAITLYINFYIIITISCNINNKSIYKYCLICLPIVILFQCIKGKIGFIGAIFEYIYLPIFALIYLKLNHIKVHKNNVYNHITIMIIMTITQLISMVVRDRNITNIANGFYVNVILSLDYFLILMIIHKLYFMEGGNSLCQVVVSYGSQKLTSLKISLRKLQRNFLNKKSKSKEEKITNAIYIPLYILWNLFTMSIIVLIAFLNDAFIEAIFITVAFWFNKRSFGKPFHFQSVALCFAFSSFTYYVLTRITFKTTTSFFIPIFLGVALSYITSHFIKKNTKLYKGMSKEDLYDTIIQVTSDPISIQICELYYCERYDDRKIANAVNYSIDSIRKKRQHINRDLRNL